MEAAGLAVGIVLPLLIEVVKSYSTISTKVHTLRHYSKELKCIDERLKVQHGIFLNEVRLLLRLVEVEEEVETMLENATDSRWMDPRLDESLKTVLRENFNVCHGIIEESQGTIESMGKELEKFNVLLEQKKKGESIKKTLRRLGGAIRIAFDKTQYDDILARLRETNGDLNALRSQIGVFQHHGLHGSNTCIRRKPLPSEVKSIQQASQKLHEALCKAWCCDDATHPGHYAKLCVEAQVRKGVQLDLAISYHDPPSKGTFESLSKPPIWLYVQSMSTSTGLNGQRASIAALPNSPTTLSPLSSLASRGVEVLKGKDLLDAQQSLSSCKKSKQKHVVNACAMAQPIPAVSTRIVQTLTPDLELCQTKNMCEYLRRTYLSTTPTTDKRCIGYLESPRLYKHIFYLPEETSAASTRPTGSHRGQPCSLFDVMQHDPDGALAVEDQLKLAHRTAPWMSERWRLSDLSYFGSHDALDAAALKTLHLSSQISAPRVITASTIPMDGIERGTGAISDQIRYGINNTTLFFLGVALLEIAHWKPIEAQMTARDQNNEIFAACRLAAGRAPLGPQYQKIAEKCLQCNFGSGTQLSSVGLQAAVYTDVVCELEGMIKKLTV